MFRRFLCVFLLLVALFPFSAACGEEEALPPAEYAYRGRVVCSYESETLHFSIEKCRPGGALCYLTKIWVSDPARQIRKATAEWEKDIRLPMTIASGIEEALLASNASGYVSPTYPGIPDHYPGTSEDYYYTPLGSLTVTDGEVFRNLSGVPYYGLTLEADGLHMYTGEENETVLSASPRQTWAFYEQCGMQRDGEDLLPNKKEWPFAGRTHARTVLARVDRNNYLMLHITREYNSGLTLYQVSSFLSKNFSTEWVYNLDGGPSSALMYRQQPGRKMRLLTRKGQKIADIIYFTD